MNITKNKMVYETKTESCLWCISLDHPFQRVVHYQRLKPVVTVKKLSRTTLGGFSVQYHIYFYLIIIINIFYPEHAPSEELLRGVH